MARPDTLPNSPTVDGDDNVVNPNADQGAVQPTTTVAASAGNDDVVAPTTTVDTTDYAELTRKAEESKEAAEKQHAEDVQHWVENPDEPLVRAGNPEVGGESF